MGLRGRQKVTSWGRGPKDTGSISDLIEMASQATQGLAPGSVSEGPCSKWPMWTSHPCPLGSHSPPRPHSSLLNFLQPTPHQLLLYHLSSSAFHSPASSPFTMYTCSSSPCNFPRQPDLNLKTTSSPEEKTIHKSEKITIY